MSSDEVTGGGSGEVSTWERLFSPAKSVALGRMFEGRSAFIRASRSDTSLGRRPPVVSPTMRGTPSSKGGGAALSHRDARCGSTGATLGVRDSSLGSALGGAGVDRKRRDRGVVFEVRCSGAVGVGVSGAGGVA